MIRASAGFTLIEMMIVVAIIAILSAIAIPAYHKYMDAGRTSEVYAMAGEIRNREEAYRAEFSTYLSSDGTSDGSMSETTFYPALTADEPTLKLIPSSGWPAGWLPKQAGGAPGLGIVPPRPQLYCGYAIVAGPAGTTPAGANGAALIGANPTTPWWYMNATCDNDGNSAVNEIFTTASTATAISTQNEHQ